MKKAYQCSGCHWRCIFITGDESRIYDVCENCKEVEEFHYGGKYFNEMVRIFIDEWWDGELDGYDFGSLLNIGVDD